MSKSNLFNLIINHIPPQINTSLSSSSLYFHIELAPLLTYAFVTLPPFAEVLDFLQRPGSEDGARILFSPITTTTEDASSSAAVWVGDAP